MSTLERALAALGLAAVTLAVTGCPGPAPQPRRPAGAPAVFVYPKGEKLPGYDKLLVGETFVYEMALKSKRTDTITAITPDELVLRRKVVLAMQAQDPREVHEKLLSTGDPFAPGGTLLGEAFKKIAEETIVVSNLSFECDVYEAKDKSRYWVANQYPFIVRSTGPDGKKTLELQQVLPQPIDDTPKGEPIVLGQDAPEKPRKSASPTPPPQTVK